MTLNSNWLCLEIFWTIYEAHYQIVSTFLYYLLTHIFSYGSPVLHKTCKCDKHTTVHLRKKKSSSPQNVTIIQSFQNWLKKKQKKNKGNISANTHPAAFSHSHTKMGKSLNGKFTVHRRLFVNEVKFLFDTIFHIYLNIS